MSVFWMLHTKSNSHFFGSLDSQGEVDLWMLHAKSNSHFFGSLDSQGEVDLVLGELVLGYF